MLVAEVYRPAGWNTTPSSVSEMVAVQKCYTKGPYTACVRQNKIDKWVADPMAQIMKYSCLLDFAKVFSL